MFWIGLGVGMVVGAILGVTVIACCIAARRGDEYGDN